MDDSSNVSALSKAIHEIHLSHMDPIAREHAKIPSSSTQGRRAQGKNDKSQTLDVSQLLLHQDSGAKKSGRAKSKASTKEKKEFAKGKKKEKEKEDEILSQNNETQTATARNSDLLSVSGKSTHTDNTVLDEAQSLFGPKRTNKYKKKIGKTRL